MKSSILEINKQAAKYFYVQLKSERGTQAYTYLKNRGLSDEYNYSRSGWDIPTSTVMICTNISEDEGYSEDLIRQAGLINTDERQGVYDKFWNQSDFSDYGRKQPGDRIRRKSDGRCQAQVPEFSRNTGVR